MKRAVSDDDDHFDERGGKRHCGGGGGGGSFRPELRLLVPSRNAGAVIGKGGANIKRLRQDFHATIILPDTNTPERLMIITGNPNVICDVLEEVIPILEERRGVGDGEPDESEVRFLIHQSQAGAIIGRGGNKVKELREETGSHIKVYTECAPDSSDRIVQVNGAPGVIVRAVEAILDILIESPPKGTVRPYDPNNWAENYISEYGGYSSRGDVGSSRGGGGGRGGGRGGFGDKRSNNVRGYRDNFDRDRDRDRERSRDRRRSAGRDDRRGSGGGSGGGRERLNTSQVSIPKDLAGLIIGRSGARINEIRQLSGANITIDDPDEGSADRIITIVGTNEQIHTAQYLLQTTVKQRNR